MKNYFSKITILSLAAAAISACSNIDENNRYIDVKPADVSPTEVYRHVLIEDFTGQRCVNCPNATDEIEKIKSEYGDSNIVAVGIHSGPLGFAGNAKVVGLLTDTGNEYYKWWNIDMQPKGIVNRVGDVSDYPMWMSLVYSEIHKTTPVTITLDNSYDEASGKATINASVFSSEDVAGKLQLWVVEDSIVTLQMMPDGSGNSNYVHNHVFRSAVNGTWGEDISITGGSTFTKQYSLTLDESWKAANVSIVAFVCDSECKNVQQVTKKALITKQE